MGKQKLLSLSLVCLLIVSVIFISGCITSKDSTTSGETKTENILYETYTSSNENGSITITKNKLTKKYTVDMTIYMNYSELEDNPLFEPSYLLNVTTKATCVILSSAFNETIREAFKNFTEQWKEFEKKEETKQGGVMKETKEKKIDLEGYEPSRIFFSIMDIDKVTKLSECIITGPREKDMTINIYNLPQEPQKSSEKQYEEQSKEEISISKSAEAKQIYFTETGGKKYLPGKILLTVYTASFVDVIKSKRFGNIVWNTEQIHRPNDGNKFCLIDMSIENIDNHEIFIDLNGLYVKDASGRIYIINAVTLGQNEGNILRPKESIRGTIAFEVPNEAEETKNFYLVWDEVSPSIYLQLE